MDYEILITRKKGKLIDYTAPHPVYNCFMIIFIIQQVNIIQNKTLCNIFDHIESDHITKNK